MSQKHMVTEEFIEGMMGEISTAMIPYQQLFSSSYREFMRYYPSFLPKFESHNSYPVVVDAFIDYDELISNYYFAQGFLGAAGGLLGQVVKPAGLKQIPGWQIWNRRWNRLAGRISTSSRQRSTRNSTASLQEKNAPLRIPGNIIIWLGMKSCLHCSNAPVMNYPINH